MYKTLREAAERNAKSETWRELYDRLLNGDLHKTSRSLFNWGATIGGTGMSGVMGIAAGNASAAAGATSGLGGFLASAAAGSAKLGVVAMGSSMLPAATVIAGGAAVAGAVMLVGYKLREMHEDNSIWKVANRAQTNPDEKAIGIGDYLRGMRDIIASKVFSNNLNSSRERADIENDQKIKWLTEKYGISRENLHAVLTETSLGKKLDPDGALQSSLLKQEQNAVKVNTQQHLAEHRVRL